jgi:hypothetical protein
MTALQLFHEAAKRGLTLKSAGSDSLAVTPARLCPPEFANILREHKPDLLALLNAGISGGTEVVKPHRPLSEREWAILVRAGAENDPIIITALNLFNATIVE